MKLKILALFILAFIGACVTAPAPVQELTLARAAIDAARAVEAGRYSPGYWGKAELSYKKAQDLYEEREYEQARLEFNKARDAAEKAENSARLIRHKNGEVM